MRAFLDAGFVVAGGTDSAVVPYPPLWVSITSCRATRSAGRPRRRSEDLAQGSAAGRDHQQRLPHLRGKAEGPIEPGKLADLVVLPEDILTVPDKRIEQMTVSMTMVGGTVVYRRP
jgi:Predicted metal-dependent hydrolase with the TIM-barrel fold